MGDQKYLDEWPARYRSCHIVQHPGAGVAPWNYAQYDFGKSRSGGIAVNGAPLIFYHFHQFQLWTNGRFERVSEYYSDYKRAPAAVYRVYEAELRRSLADVRRVSPGFSSGMKTPRQVPIGIRIRRVVPRQLRDRIKGWFAPVRMVG